jgi:hypothetical protein
MRSEPGSRGARERDGIDDFLHADGRCVQRSQQLEGRRLLPAILGIVLDVEGREARRASLDPSVLSKPSVTPG